VDQKIKIDIFVVVDNSIVGQLGEKRLNPKILRSELNPNILI
jgi:hypothetical protein